jgi:xanthine/uracil permease
MYKSMTASPFDTHEGVMLAFFIAFFIYATASVAEIMLRARESIYHPIVSYIRLFASGLATILLLVILDPVLGYIISVLWGCLFARVAYESCKELQELRSHTAQLGHLGHSLWTKLVGVLGYHNEEEPDQAIRPAV